MVVNLHVEVTEADASARTKPITSKLPASHVVELSTQHVLGSKGVVSLLGKFDVSAFFSTPPVL